MALIAATARGKLEIRELLAAVTLVSLAWPGCASSQSCTNCRNEHPATTSEHVALFSVNALLGGMTAGLLRLVRGTPFVEAVTDGFSRGAVGGGVSYAGKRLAASDFDGAGFLGREIAAIGASTTANAADGLKAFERMLLPLGPLPMRLVLTRDESRYSIRPLIDLLSTAGLLYGLAATRYDFDWNASLSGGVAVFRETNPYLNEFGGFDVETIRMVNAANPSLNPRFGEYVGATTVGSTIFTSYLAPEDNVLAHVRVHALQFDFVATTLSDRADTWTLARIPSVNQWLKLNLVPMAFGAFNQVVVPLSKHDGLPWEREAILLSGHR